MRLRSVMIVCTWAAFGLAATAQSPTGGQGESTKNWEKEYADFLKLPAAQRQRMRELDKGLQSEGADTQARLFRVMERYLEWLNKLSAEDRRAIAEAASTADKLQRIRAIREKQWISTLPKVERDKIATASPDERKELLAKIRKREAEKDLAWQLSETRAEEREEFNRWRREQMNKWLEKELYPKLTTAEKNRLQDSVRSGRVNFPQVVELAKKHQISVPEPLLKLRNPPRWPAFGSKERPPR